jgi:hypothetical protein
LEGNKDSYEAALEAWDSGDAWAVACSIQVEVSRARRLMTLEAHNRLNEAQNRVVSALDKPVDDLRESADPMKWDEFCHSLWVLRGDIDNLLNEVAKDLALDRTSVLLGRPRGR